MPKLGLGSKSTNSGLITPGIVTDNLVLKHKYDAGSVIPISDGAASFAKTNTDYISTNFIPDYIHTNASMGMWVYFKSISEQTMGHHGGLRWYMGIDGSGDCFMGVADAHTGGDNVSGGIVANKWLHIAVTAIDGTATYYVNGIAKHTKSYTQNSAHNPDEGWYIGARNNNGGVETNMDAYMANVFQYNVGLTQAQIKSIMNKNYAALSDSEKTNLVAWWNLDQNSIYQNPGDRSNSSYWGGKSIVVYQDGASDGAGGNTSFHEAVVSKDGDLSSDLFGGEGSFNNGDTGYFTDSFATYGSGAVTFRNTGYNALSKGSLLTVGKIYRLDFDVLSYDSDITKLQFNWGSLSPGGYPVIWEVAEGTGSFSATFKSPITSFVVYATGDGGAYKSITLDNLVLREVQNAGELS